MLTSLSTSLILLSIDQCWREKSVRFRTMGRHKFKGSHARRLTAGGKLLWVYCCDCGRERDYDGHHARPEEPT